MNLTHDIQRSIKEQNSVKIPQIKTVLAIDTFQAFIIEKLHLPVIFTEASLDTIDMEVLADHALKGASSMPRAYRELTRDDCIAIYEMCK